MSLSLALSLYLCLCLRLPLSLFRLTVYVHIHPYSRLFIDRFDLFCVADRQVLSPKNRQLVAGLPAGETGSTRGRHSHGRRSSAKRKPDGRKRPRDEHGGSSQRGERQRGSVYKRGRLHHGSPGVRHFRERQREGRSMWPHVRRAHLHVTTTPPV